MNIELSNFAARLRATISHQPSTTRLGEASEAACIGHRQFDELALELFALQFKYNPTYAKICAACQLSPETITHWTQIPFVPTGAFKELEVSSIPPGERTAVFHSSGTAEQKPSRHFHCAESLALYETSLWQWFKPHFSVENEFVSLTPHQTAAPHSSLVHMFETVKKNVGSAKFFGQVSADGGWTIDFDAVVQSLRFAGNEGQPLTILGTAFSFVHLLDYLTAKDLRFNLPENSQVMETGGYKNRSRILPKVELHALITQQLGIPRENIICEYGMSELSSQAYDNVTRDMCQVTRPGETPRPTSPVTRHFHFPPWAGVQIISPETGREVADGETGLIRIFDLANVFSVAAIQTEDLGVRRGDGCELLGRVQLAEPRGCSLMSA
jgi:hypothetical protein